MKTQKELILEELKALGIHNEAELKRSIQKDGFVDIGIFTFDFNNVLAPAV